jgi:hypothetical protein
MDTARLTPQTASTAPHTEDTAPEAARTTSRRSPIRWEHALVVAAAVGVVIVAARAIVYYTQMPDPEGAIGVDYRLYVGAAQRWLDTGQFYWPAQVAGPYHVHDIPSILYPPPVLYLLVPFTILPGVLFWVIPAILTAVAFWRLRPAPWSLMAMVGLAASGVVQGPIFWGTPVFWLVPVVAWGGLLGWPAPFVLLKPTLAPFALVGLRRPRSFLFGFVLLALLSAPFIGLWFDWLAVIRNSDLSPTYGIEQVALLLVPALAVIGSTRPRRETAAA